MFQTTMPLQVSHLSTTITDHTTQDYSSVIMPSLLVARLQAAGHGLDRSLDSRPNFMGLIPTTGQV